MLENNPEVKRDVVDLVGEENYLEAGIQEPGARRWVEAGFVALAR